MHSIFRYFGFLAFTGWTAAAAGSTAAPAEPGGGVNLDPVVVTAFQTQQPLVVRADPRAPAQPVPAHDGADVLKGIPGFAVIRKGGTDGDPVLRGMAGSRLGVEIDGQFLYGGCGNRMDPPTAYVFPAAYDRITVIKGPQTVRHGPGNSAGVVRFERDYRRFDHPQASLFGSLTTGSAGRFDALADVRAGVPDWQLRITGTTTRADDYADGAGADVHSAYERWSANAALAWTPDERTFVEVSTARSDGEAAYADRAMDGVAFARENYAARFRRERLTPLVAAVEARVFHNDVDHVMDNYSLRPFVASAMMPAPAVSNPDRLTRGGLAQIELTAGDRTTLTAGLDAQENRHTLRVSSDQGAAPYQMKARVRDAQVRQTGAFAEAATTLAPGRRLYAGARFDRWRAYDARASIALGSMGTVSNPSFGRTRRSGLTSGFVRYEHDLDLKDAPLTLFTGLGRVQRFPDYWELIKNESAATASAFGTEPETTTQVDAGVVYRARAVEFNASVFAARIDDFILVQTGWRKPGGMTGARSATISRNVDATTYGGEAGVVWRFASDWKLDVSVSAVHGENDTEDRPLAQMPPLEARAGLSYVRPLWSAGALLRAVARQERVAVNQGNIAGQDVGPSAGFATLALHASRRFGAKARLSAGVDNVLDRVYAEHLSKAGAAVAGFAQTTRVNEPGRTWWLKFDVSY